MYKKQWVDLNNYDRVPLSFNSQNEQLPPQDDQFDLAIIPIGESPVMYWKRKKPIGLTTSTNDIEWNEEIKFDTHVSQDEYNKYIDWWFGNITDEYIDKLLKLTENAVEKGWDLSMSVQKCKDKLKILPLESRKSKLSKYLIKWIIDGSTYWLRKKGS
jgi:hypothetical protein